VRNKTLGSGEIRARPGVPFHLVQKKVGWNPHRQAGGHFLPESNVNQGLAFDLVRTLMMLRDNSKQILANIA